MLRHLGHLDTAMLGECHIRLRGQPLAQVPTDRPPGELDPDLVYSEGGVVLDQRPRVDFAYHAAGRHVSSCPPPLLALVATIHIRKKTR